MLMLCGRVSLYVVIVIFVLEQLALGYFRQPIVANVPKFSMCVCTFITRSPYCLSSRDVCP